MSAAATWTWTGVTNTAWANSGNWSPSTGSPQTGDTAILDSALTANVLTLTGTELSNNVIDLSNGAVVDFANGSSLDGTSTVAAVGGSAGTIDVTGGVFTDFGNIEAYSGNTLVLSIASGATLLSNGPTLDGPGTDVGINAGDAGAFNGGTLFVLGGTLDNQEIHVNGGSADVTSALMNNDELSINGGQLEIFQESTVSPSQITFINSDTSIPSVLKFDNPSTFDGDGRGMINAFKTGDTLDIGTGTVGTIIYNIDTTYGIGTLTVENTSGSTLFTAQLSGGDAANFQTGTFGLSGTVAGSFQVITGSGDTLISEATSSGTTTPPPGPATWSWNGGSGAYNTSNWTTVSGTSAATYPQNNDSVIIPTGTVDVSNNAGGLYLDNLNLGGVAGASLVLTDNANVEAAGGLVMLGTSTLSIDGNSSVDLGSSGLLLGGTIVIDNGASLLGSGQVSAPAVLDNGQIVVSNAATASASTGGTLEITGSIVSGSAGGMTLTSGSTLMLDGAIGSGPAIAFTAGASAETLVLGSPGTAFANAITGLANGDIVAFSNGITVDSATLSNGTTIDVNYSQGGTTGTYDLTNVGFADGAGTSFAVAPGLPSNESGIVLLSGLGTGTLAVSGAIANQADAAGVAIAPLAGVAITDTNLSQTETVTVTLSSTDNGTLTNLAGGSYDPGTGIYTINGSAAAVTSALDGLTFTPTATLTGTVTTGFTIAVTDTAGQTANGTASVVATGGSGGGTGGGGGTSNTGTLTVTGAVASQADTAGAAIAPLSGVTISDTNVNQTETVTVTLSSAGNGTLSNLAGGSYNAATGVYTVAGSATAVTAALDGLSFTPAATLTGTVTTGFTIAVTDTAGQTATNSTASVVSAATSTTGITPPPATTITEVYQDILGRSPDPAGAAYWQQLLSSGTPIATIEQDIAFSPEAQSEIQGFYQQILGRTGSPGEVAAWQNVLGSGVPLATIQADFAQSPEAQNDIQNLYQQILGRSGSPGEVAAWQNLLANGVSLAAVKTDFAQSPEAQSDIQGFYQQILGRSGSPGEVAAWQNALANGTSLPTVKADFAASPEASGDLSTAYQTVYGSAPNQGVLATLEARLVAGGTLSAIENSLHGPLVFDTVAGQAITDHSTVQPFGVAQVTDPNSGTETATITLTGASGTATDANGTLSGTGLTHGGAGTYTLSASNAAGLTSELNALVFTPTQGQVTAGQSTTTNISVSVNDGTATGSDSLTSITATAVGGSPTSMNFIYGSAGSDTFTEASSPTVIAENANPLGSDVATSFNAAQDIVQLSAAMFANYTAVQAAMTAVNGSAVIAFGNSGSLTLQGVAPSALHASNFQFV